MCETEKNHCILSTWESSIRIRNTSNISWYHGSNTYYIIFRFKSHKCLRVSFLNSKLSDNQREETPLHHLFQCRRLIQLFSMDDTFFKTRPDQETKPDSKDSKDGLQSGKGASGTTSHCSNPSNPTCDQQQSLDVIPARKGGPLIDPANPDRPVVDRMAAQGFFCASWTCFAFSNTN